jgi:hypothetical protein
VITVSEVINALKLHGFGDKDEFEKLTGYTLQEIGMGEFRVAYLINGTDLVIKVPLIEDGIEENIRHARTEYRRWHDIMHHRKWFLLRKYMPAIHYYCEQEGVILMQHYPEAPDTATVRRDIKWIRRLVDVVTRFNGIHDNYEDQEEFDWISDIAITNIGIDKTGQYKFLDMGLFETEDDI